MVYLLLDLLNQVFSRSLDLRDDRVDSD